MTDTEKKMVAIRYWCLGRNYFTAVKALEYASQFHTGKRKDGVTPEFDHQLSIAAYIRSIATSLVCVDATLAAVFLHDVCEDYDIGFEEIETRFGFTISKTVRLLTKKFRGETVAPGAYYKAIAGCAIASVVKGADRIHNIQTMTEVFDLPKQVQYIKETEEHVLPMLKQARRRYPEQEPAYENEKHVLKSQIDLIWAIHKGLKK